MTAKRQATDLELVTPKPQPAFRCRLSRGDPAFGKDNAKPDLELVCDGPEAYAWIGQERCYAIIDGKDLLRKLAKEILKALGEE